MKKIKRAIQKAKGQVQKVQKWVKDERSSVLSETSLMVAVCIIGGVALGALALPKLSTYATTVYTDFDGATTAAGFPQ